VLIEQHHAINLCSSGANEELKVGLAAPEL